MLLCISAAPLLTTIIDARCARWKLFPKEEWNCGTEPEVVRRSEPLCGRHESAPFLERLTQHGFHLCPIVAAHHEVRSILQDDFELAVRASFQVRDGFKIDDA